MRQTNKSETEFKILYDRHFDSVARYSLRRLPEQVAQDAMSEVFLTAWRSWIPYLREMTVSHGCMALPRTS